MEGAFSNIGSAEIADSGMEFGALVGYDYFAYNEDRRVELPLNVETIAIMPLRILQAIPT